MAGESWKERSRRVGNAAGSIGQITSIYPYVVRTDIGQTTEAGAWLVTFRVKGDEAQMFAMLRTLYPKCARATVQPSPIPATEEDPTPPVLLKVRFSDDREIKEFADGYQEYRRTKAEPNR